MMHLSDKDVAVGVEYRVVGDSERPFAYSIERLFRRIAGEFSILSITAGAVLALPLVSTGLLAYCYL